ncbi:hypothetical protein FRC12_002578 [Ceratobasidium sp. 428]|nr:hypothetical protein FRC12_002578 [Ceratobasidium sp. 428]
MNRLVDLWNRKTSEQWLTGSPYPQRIQTNQIPDWPEPNDDPDVRALSLQLMLCTVELNHLVLQDPDWLCNLNRWVGSYPIPLNNTSITPKTTDPGPFRALVSSSYKKDGTGGDVAYTFAFCGLVSRVGDEYEMCWPLGEEDEQSALGWTYEWSDVSFSGLLSYVHVNISFSLLTGES